jgi:uncharacterized protein involved in exopolysaccharide biosynthesis
MTQLELELVELKTRYKETADPVLQHEKQIQELRAKLESLESQPAEIVTGVDPRVQEAELLRQTATAELQAQLSMEKSLDADLEKAEADLARLNASSKRVLEVQREIELAEAKYRRFVNTLNTAEMSEMLDKDQVGNVTVLQPATLPAGTSSSQRKKLAILAIGLFMGLAAGVALAFMIDYLDHSLKTTEDVERHLGLPVLAALPARRGHWPQARKEIAP